MTVTASGNDDPEIVLGDDDPAPSAPPASFTGGLPTAVATPAVAVALPPSNTTLSGGIIERTTNADGSLSVQITTTTPQPNGYRELIIEFFHIPASAAEEVALSLDNGDPPSGLYMTKMEQQTLPPGTGAVMSRPPAYPTPGHLGGQPPQAPATVSAGQPHQPPSTAVVAEHESSAVGNCIKACAACCCVACLVIIIAAIVGAASTTTYYPPSTWTPPSPSWTPAPYPSPSWHHLYPTPPHPSPTGSPHPTSAYTPHPHPVPYEQGRGAPPTVPAASPTVKNRLASSNGAIPTTATTGGEMDVAAEE